ncbi:MAG: hypothetical protein AB7S98_24420, partial [Burkholderiaceae bacterium]
MDLRKSVKLSMFGLACVLVSPALAAAWLERRLSSSEQVFSFFAQALALVPGLPGVYLRGAYYFGTLASCSWETHVGFGSIIVRRAAALGRRASMGAYCVIGHADIGESAMIGSRVSVPSGKRQHLDETGALSGDKGQFDRVAVGPGCWIGEGAIQLADVGARSIVSAG